MIQHARSYGSAFMSTSRPKTQELLVAVVIDRSPMKQVCKDQHATMLAMTHTMYLLPQLS